MIPPILALAAINLMCIGAASKDQEIGTIGSLIGGESHVQRIETEDSVSFRIEADNTGEARIPKRLQSTYKEREHDGWFPLVSVVQAQDEITGQVRLHGMYKPRFRLDRLTGVVTMSGSLGSFSGHCEAYDPATVQRKF